MKKLLLFVLTVVSINMAYAGKVTIETNESLIRNDVFDEKRARAEEYKRSEDEREANNQQWFDVLPVGCILYRNYNSIYRCQQGNFYRMGSGSKYRKLNHNEISSIEKTNSNVK